MSIDLQTAIEDGSLARALSTFVNPEEIHDVAVAKAFVAENVNTLRHSAALGWFAWNGKMWAPASRDLVLDRVRVFNEGLITRNVANSGVVKKLAGYVSASGIERVQRVVRAMGPIRVDDPSQFDADRDLLNVQNGIVDLRTGTLLPHDPARMMTKITRAAYDPHARHGDLEKTLAALPDLDVRRWVKRVLGSGCSGRTPSDDMSVVLDGVGSNGKSTIMAAARTALGDYAMVVPNAALSGEKEHPTAVAEFRGLRLAILDETPEERKLNIQMLKQLSSGNEVRARYMREDYFTFLPSHTLVVATNHRPVVTETDRGTWRRLGLVPFPLTFGTQPGDLPVDNGLRDRMSNSPTGQWEATLAWLVEGAKAWYDAERTLRDMPDAVQDATRSWRTESDLIYLFALERLEFGVTNSVSSPELGTTFNEWAQGRHHRGWSARTFNANFERHEVATSHAVSRHRASGVDWWMGVGLKKSPSMAELFEAAV